jgi:hypothetical protein
MMKDKTIIWNYVHLKIYGWKYCIHHTFENIFFLLFLKSVKLKYSKL